MAIHTFCTFDLGTPRPAVSLVEIPFPKPPNSCRRPTFPEGHPCAPVLPPSPPPTLSARGSRWCVVHAGGVRSVRCQYAYGKGFGSAGPLTGQSMRNMCGAVSLLLRGTDCPPPRGPLPPPHLVHLGSDTPPPFPTQGRTPCRVVRGPEPRTPARPRVAGG